MNVISEQEAMAIGKVYVDLLELAKTANGSFLVSYSLSTWTVQIQTSEQIVKNRGHELLMTMLGLRVNFTDYLSDL